MKTNLRKQIETIYEEYEFRSKGCALSKTKNYFKKGNIEFRAKKDGLQIGFNNSDVTDQECFDYINNKYGKIHVHHGNYALIRFDLSHCVDPDSPKKEEHPNQAYYTCERLDLDNALELFEYLSCNCA